MKGYCDCGNVIDETEYTQFGNCKVCRTMEDEQCKECFYYWEFDQDGVFCSVCKEDFNFKLFITPEDWLNEFIKRIEK